MPEISVVVPVYNVELYISKCIDSILSQTFTDFELILIDDGSQDQSGAICDNYAQNDNRITVVHQSNTGQATARNRAVSQSIGRYICFVDSDDVIHPQMLELLYNALSNRQNTISTCRIVEGKTVNFQFDNIARVSRYEEFKPNETGLLQLFDKPYVCWTNWGKLLPAQIVKNHPFADGRVYEDNAIVVQWLCDAEIIICLSEYLYFYRANQESTTKSGWSEKKALDYAWARSEQLKFFADHNMNQLFDRFYSPFIYDLACEYHSRKKTHPKFSKSIQKIAARWWKHYSNKAIVTKNQRQYINSVVYPLEEHVVEWLENHKRKTK